jgi:hypothetical protein
MNIKKRKEKKPESSNKKEQVETKENLTKLLQTYSIIFAQASTRASRISDLLLRPSSKDWSKTKKEKMLKRHKIAAEEASFAFSAVDQITFRLTQLTEN